MFGLLETLGIYIVIGIIYNAITDDKGETWKVLRGLIYKAIWWPKDLYDKFIKIEEYKK